MRVRYHVIVVEPSSAAILIDRQASVWLLPSMTGENTVRGTDVVRRGLAALGLSGRIRWMEAFAFHGDAAELQMLAVVDAASRCANPAFVAAPVQDIDTRGAMLATQAEALTIFRGIAGEDDGPYRHARTWHALDEWLEGTLAAAGLRRTPADRQYKALARESVMTLVTTAGTVHFKGRAEQPFVEAELAQYLAAHWPAHVARTLAYDRSRGWWLTLQAPGSSLTNTITLPKALAVVDTLATMQADTCAHVNELVRLGCPTLDLDHIVRRALALLDDARAHHDHAHLSEDMRDALAGAGRVAAAITEAVATMHALQPPIAWLHTDLADSNIFVAEADNSARIPRVTFIDLASPFLGAPPIALYSFLHYLPRYVDRDRLIGEGWTSALKARYAKIWTSRGWPHAEECFWAAKLVAYAMKTLKGLESPLTRGVRDEAVRKYVGVRSAARLCQAVLAARGSRDRPDETRAINAARAGKSIQTPSPT